MNREPLLHSLNTTPQESLIKNLESIRDSIKTVLLYQRSLNRVEDSILLEKVLDTTLSLLEKSTKPSRKTLIEKLEYIRNSINTILLYQRSLSRVEDRIRLKSVLDTVDTTLSLLGRSSKTINGTLQVSYDSEGPSI